MANSSRDSDSVFVAPKPHQEKEKVIRYDDTSPCPTCNELDADCACARELELRSSMNVLGLSTQDVRGYYYVGQHALERVDDALAMIQRTLREYGYK